MALSEAKTTILDGGLGIAAASGDQLQVKIGASSLGTINVPVTVGDASQISALFGVGPLCDAARAALAIPGEGPVIMVRAPSSTAGAAGSTTSTKTGTGSLAYSGSVNGAYAAVIKITNTGSVANGAATFQYSLDNGTTFTGDIAVPSGGAYTIPGTGLVATFTDGATTPPLSFTAGDLYSTTSTGPSYTSTEAMAAVDGAFTSADDFAFIHLVGTPASVSAAAALAAALETKLTAWEAMYRYARGFVEIPTDTDANIKSGFASVTSVEGRTLAVASYCDMSELDGIIRKRHAAWAVTARAGAVKASEDLGRVKSGALRNVQKLYRDEAQTQALDAVGIITLRSYVGKDGYYITRPTSLAAPTSDFKLFQRGRVIDIAAKVVRAKGVELLRDTIPTDPLTGFIDEVFARAVERDFKDALGQALLEPGNATKVDVLIDRTANLLSGVPLRVTHKVQPYAYAEQITQTLSFENPAIA